MGDHRDLSAGPVLARFFHLCLDGKKAGTPVGRRSSLRIPAHPLNEGGPTGRVGDVRPSQAGGARQ
jgi:hypothetical protein